MSRHIPSLIRSILDDAMIRNIVMVGGASALAQGGFLIMIPFITRLYDPYDFGLFSVFSVIVSFAAGIVFARLETSLPLCRDHEVATALLLMGTIACTVFVVLAIGMWGLLLLVPMDPLTASVLYHTTVALPLVYTPVIPLYFCIRARAFHRYAVIDSVRLLGQGAGQLALALQWPDVRGLIWGYAAGSLLAAVVGWVISPVPETDFRRTGWRQVRAYVSRFRNHPLYMMPGAVGRALAHFLPPFLLALLYDPSVAGLYVLAQRILAAPIRLVAQAVSQVVLGELARASSEEATARIDRLLLLLAGAGVVFTALVLAPGREGWVWFLGDESWKALPDMLMLLLPAVALRMLLDSTRNVLVVGRRQQWMFCESVLLLAGLAVSYGGVRLSGGGAWFAILLHTLLTVSIQAGQLIVVRRTASRLTREPSREEQVGRSEGHG